MCVCVFFGGVVEFRRFLKSAFKIILKFAKQNTVYTVYCTVYTVYSTVYRNSGRSKKIETPFHVLECLFLCTHVYYNTIVVFFVGRRWRSPLSSLPQKSGALPTSHHISCTMHHMCPLVLGCLVWLDLTVDFKLQSITTLKEQCHEIFNTKKKNSSWAPYKQPKMVSRNCSFS